MLRLAIPAALCFAATAALAQPDASGIDFVTVGSPGNAPWTGGGLNNNRGEVDYSYRIGKYEVTTQQWCDFMNAALDRPSNDHIPHVFAPTQWGAVATTPTNPGGHRFTVPAGNAMLPTGGVDWRTCAIFCNWLCNGKSSARGAFLTGAYDVSTFTYFNGGSRFTDQLTHNPGAAYWVPTLDEWMKSAHWDPNRNGPGQGGWWLYSNTSENPYVYGPPGYLVNGQLATANAGWDDITVPGHDPFAVPLGAYPTVTTPWGLFDAAGGASEWLEESHTIPGDTLPISRLFEGSAWSAPIGRDDEAGYVGGADSPTSFGYDMGFRVAAVVPSPGWASMAVSLALLGGFKRRRPASPV
jgi:formylglycine-generating enzyme required for sulfatase activity